MSANTGEIKDNSFPDSTLHWEDSSGSGEILSFCYARPKPSVNPNPPSFIIPPPILNAKELVKGISLKNDEE